MAIEIVAYAREHLGALQRFNARLAAAGVDMQFPEDPATGFMPGSHCWVAAEDREIRGGYVLRHQTFFIGGEPEPVAHYRLPLSEGLVNREYAHLALRLVRDALAREKYLYTLGMGGWDKPLPEMLKRLKWRMAEVSFYFKAPHPYRFLRQIRALRTSPLQRLACDAAACTGTGWLALWLAGIARRTNGPPPLEVAKSFGDWADVVWNAARVGYGMTAARDAATLDSLYPPGGSRFLRLRTKTGWAVLLDTSMHGHKQFGNLRVGTIADCFAPPEHAPDVVRTAARFLEERGVDLIVSNQLHKSWGDALAAAGFRQAPTNYLLAVSPALAARMGSCLDDQIHVNRGDGDGPIHL